MTQNSIDNFLRAQRALSRTELPKKSRPVRRNSKAISKHSMQQLNKSPNLGDVTASLILRDYAKKLWTQRELAVKYDTTPPTINFIVKRKTYKHVKAAK